MSEKTTIIRDEHGEPIFAVVPWQEYKLLIKWPARGGPRSPATDMAAFKRALAARPSGGDVFDIGLAEAGASFKAREARARGRAARRSGKPVGFTPIEVVAALVAGGKPLKAWREHAGLTQQRLAEQAGVSRAYLAQLESGARVGTVDVLARLAAALGCLVDDLID